MSDASPAAPAAPEVEPAPVSCPLCGWSNTRRAPEKRGGKILPAEHHPDCPGRNMPKSERMRRGVPDFDL